LIDDAEHQWAPPTDPGFDLVPPLCDEHISSVYAQLGCPDVNFHSFWDVYNQVCDAVDSDFLFRSSIGVIDEENEPEDSELDARQGPLQHLQPCEFGKDGILPMQHEGETDLVTSFLPTLFLIYCLSSEEPEYSARFSEGAPGAVVSNLVSACADFFLEDDIMVEFSDDDGDELF